MVCSRCKIKMKEVKHLAHGKRKWICPECGKVKMQVLKKARKKRKKESFQY
ncbi:MAG: hypothetical protein J7M18_05700 [Candidatus Eremiobacteraeota bacterium]|nr:hypothetical protein [Candidatus Eremiobacteraeota bacterium]